MSAVMPDYHCELSAQPTQPIQLGWQQQLEQLRGQVIATDERLYWMLMLRENAAELPVGSAQLLDLMIDLAEQLYDWPMVVHLRLMLFNQQAKRDEKQDQQQNEIDNLLLLVRAYQAQGLLVEASQCVEKMLLLHYQQPSLVACYARLQQQIAAMPFDLAYQSVEPLMLVPMSEQHLEVFSWVYDHQSIAHLCNLPEFECDQHWLNWLHNCQANEHVYLFAIMHPQWGFIGSVSLELFNGVGYFYFWLGLDFQRQGFGPKAVDRLFSIGCDHLGLRCCYAKVYDYNQPSQKAMVKLGFKRLPVTLQPPADNEWLYHCGPDKSAQQIVSELEQMFVDQCSGDQLADALAWRMGLNN